MEYKVSEQEAFRVLAKKKIVAMNDESGEVGQFWQEMMTNYHDKFMDLLDQANPKAFLGMYGDYDFEAETMAVWIGIQSDSEMIEDFEKIEIPASKWAIFPITGPSNEAIPAAWPQIFTRLEKDQIKLTELPSLEVYLAEDIQAEDAYNEIWIPIQ